MDELKAILIDQAKAHPLAVALTVVVLASLLGGLFLFGAIAGHIDPDAMPSARLAALVRIGRRLGVVFQGSRADFAQLWSGEWRTPRSTPPAPLPSDRDRPTDPGPPPDETPPTPRDPWAASQPRPGATDRGRGA